MGDGNGVEPDPAHAAGLRRMSCSNSLRQVGLAMHNYESLYRSLPPAGCRDADFSVQARVLPFIERSGLYGRLICPVKRAQ